MYRQSARAPRKQSCCHVSARARRESRHPRPAALACCRAAYYWMILAFHPCTLLGAAPCHICYRQTNDSPTTPSTGAAWRCRNTKPWLSRSQAPGDPRPARMQVSANSNARSTAAAVAVELASKRASSEPCPLCDGHLQLVRELSWRHFSWYYKLTNSKVRRFDPQEEAKL